MRKLKDHEKRLLKKVDFFNYKRDSTARENTFLRRYLIQDREDYHKYNKICGIVTKLTGSLRQLGEGDAFRIKMTELLIDKLYRMGVVSRREGLAQTEGLSASAFCRRRLSVVLMKLKMADNLKHAVSLVEQGHVRVGSSVVTDPALHVTREGEDLVAWAEGSAIKRHVKEFNNALDDFDLLAA